jgi:hypothetical protein
MKRAFLNLRLTKPDRVEMFTRGLMLNGYKVIPGVTMNPGPQDLLVTWNRIGTGASAARAFETAGRPVLVTENATWGNGFAGLRWYHIARNRHNTAGMFPVGGPGRWDALGVGLDPWRTEGETVILAQRGIGSPPTKMPQEWPQQALARHGGRIRRHPGTKPAKALEADLASAGRVVTWGSGAALWALMHGIPVVSEMPNWIGEQDNTDAGRLAMLRRLAWAQWTHEEIADGLPFRRLLCES